MSTNLPEMALVQLHDAQAHEDFDMLGFVQAARKSSRQKRTSE